MTEEMLNELSAQVGKRFKMSDIFMCLSHIPISSAVYGKMVFPLMKSKVWVVLNDGVKI